MRVEIDINKKDFWNFNRYATLTIPKLRNIFIMDFMGMPVVLLLILMVSGLPPLYSVLTALLGGAFCDLCIYMSFRVRILKLADKKQELLGKHTIEIYPLGAVKSTNGNEVTYNWKSIKKVSRDKINIYFFLDEMTAQIIPKRSFKDEKEFDEFYSKSLDFWKVKHHKL